MCNALNPLARAGWSAVSSISCLVPHGVCKPWQDSEESGKLESGWHTKSFLKCHCLSHKGLFQHLCLPSGLFSNRCSRWTSLTALPCEYETNPPPVWDARWQRKVALLIIAGLMAFLWMSSRDLHFCRRKCWMLWFTVTVGLGAWKAWASQQFCPGTRTASSGLKTTLNCKVKCYSWDWKSAAGLECFVCPKPCSDLTD